MAEMQNTSKLAPGDLILKKCDLVRAFSNKAGIAAFAEIPRGTVYYKNVPFIDTNLDFSCNLNSRFGY